MADQLIRATAADGGIRAVGVITTRLSEEARQRHKLSYVATAALGRSMSAGLLLASSMKRSESRVNIRIRGNGPMGGLMVDAGTDGTVRGYVDHPDVELPPNAKGKLDVGGAIGTDGYVYVVRDVGYGYPYSSTVELVSGEIGDDITNYLVTSEQTPSALFLGVFVDPNGVQAAGGLLVQILPKAASDPALVELLESRLSTLQGFTPLLQAGKTLPTIFEELLGDLGLEIFPSQIVRFHCGCSVDRVLGALKLLGEAELRDMIETDKGAEATCHFCGEVYKANIDQLEQLIDELKEAQ
ncbi:Hsp33 family molecular chaperone HslO [Leptolyngbya sp. NIES-2104]|uniref:Hsp33 family molecular chaperone HslO n=1 Tax=Leptolyngbya sp. NIES-2104 TaxID=1552121 RepID=UPI0006ECCA8A|nr:Hsp33 family molecular chaperone HslO [Leptolyngbya sp. NIES-2104]GAP94739.1 chaperonin [Leptolyngbya sp. NIES-2104]